MGKTEREPLHLQYTPRHEAKNLSQPGGTRTPASQNHGCVLRYLPKSAVRKPTAWRPVATVLACHSVELEFMCMQPPSGVGMRMLWLSRPENSSEREGQQTGVFT